MTRVLPLLLLAVGCPKNTESAGELSFGALLPVVDHMEASMIRALEGSDAYRAFHPYTLRPSAKRVRERQAHARNLGIHRVQLTAIEFELVLMQGGKPAHRINTVVHPTATGAVLLLFKHDKGDSFGTQAVDTVFGHAAPFAVAARALANHVTGPNCTDIPFLTADEVRAWGLPMSENDAEELAVSASQLPQLCEGLNAVQFDSLALRVNDAAFMAYDDQGHILGILTTELEIGDDGQVAVVFPHFRDLPSTH